MKDFFQSDKRIFLCSQVLLKLKASIHSFSRKNPNGKKNAQKTSDLSKNQHINCYQIVVTNKRHIQRKRVIYVSFEEDRRKKNEKQKKTVNFLWENKFWFFVVVLSKWKFFRIFSHLTPFIFLASAFSDHFNLLFGRSSVRAYKFDFPGFDPGGHASIGFICGPDAFGHFVRFFRAAAMLFDEIISVSLFLAFLFATFSGTVSVFSVWPLRFRFVRRPLLRSDHRGCNYNDLPIFRKIVHIPPSIDPFKKLEFE